MTDRPMSPRRPAPLHAVVVVFALAIAGAGPAGAVTHPTAPLSPGPDSHSTRPHAIDPLETENASENTTDATATTDTTDGVDATNTSDTTTSDSTNTAGATTSDSTNAAGATTRGTTAYSSDTASVIRTIDATNTTDTTGTVENAIDTGTTTDTGENVADTETATNAVENAAETVATDRVITDGPDTLRGTAEAVTDTVTDAAGGAGDISGAVDRPPGNAIGPTTVTATTRVGEVSVPGGAALRSDATLGPYFAGSDRPRSTAFDARAADEAEPSVSGVRDPATRSASNAGPHPVDRSRGSDSTNGGSIPPLAVGAATLGTAALAVAGRQALSVANASGATPGRAFVGGAGDGWRDRFWRFFAILGYQRYDDTDPLEHETREAIYRHLRETPGSYLTEVSEATDVPLPTVRYHLKILEHENLVTRTKMRGKRRYFPIDSDPSELDAALNDDAPAAVLTALARRGPASVSDLAEALDRDPSTVTYHLQELADENLVERERDGRSTVNRLAPEVEAAITEREGPTPEPAE